MYPERYRLPQVTAHVLALLERRRPAFEAFDEATERTLREEAERALAEAGVQFREVADDPAYWQRLTDAVLGVAWPRWVRIARDQHALERRKYGIWRGGDWIARGAYAGGSLLVAFVIAVTALPDWLEPLPLAGLLFGPFVPDVRVWWAERRWRGQLQGLVAEMADEQAQRETYLPMKDGAPLDRIDERATSAGDRAAQKETTR